MRIRRVLELMKQADVDCLIIKNRSNIRYITGFTGDAGILYIDDVRGVLVTDGRFTEQARTQMHDFEVLEYKGDLWKTVAGLARPAERIGFDGNRFTYDEYCKLKKFLLDRDLVSVDLEGIRQIKERQELDMLITAARMADEAFIKLLSQIRAGQTELEVAAILEHEMKLQGSEKTSFETIVVSGPRSSLPHGQPGGRRLQAGDFITFDFGAMYEGYHSDMTRTVVMGRATEWHRKIYGIVQKAQAAGVASARIGMNGQQLDALVRKVVADAGYGEYFIHGTGHGVGLEIHELPNINKLGTTALQKGMVFSIEPGIYIPSKGGVRIEDTVVLTEEGAQPLNGITKQLIEII